MPSAHGLRQGAFRVFQGLLLGIGMASCAFFRVQNDGPVRNDRQSSLSDQWFLAVPFFPDNTDQCGPSALASVLTFWGHPTDPGALKKEIYLAHLKGSLPLDLFLAAQSRGFNARLYSGSIDDLKSQLRKGYPLVAFIDRGFDHFPIGHYVVVNGYDEARKGLYVHSGLVKNQFVHYERFLRDWDRTQRSTLLILPARQDRKSRHGGT